MYFRDVPLHPNLEQRNGLLYMMKSLPTPYLTFSSLCKKYSSMETCQTLLQCKTHVALF